MEKKRRRVKVVVRPGFYVPGARQLVSGEWGWRVALLIPYQPLCWFPAVHVIESLAVEKAKRLARSMGWEYVP